MGEIDYRFKIDGKYEFLLEYPTISQGFNRWSQTISPNDATESTPSSDMGLTYDENELTWPDGSFGGIRKSETRTKTYFDCSLQSWHFAVGAYVNFSKENTFPGPYTSPTAAIHIKCVILWIRVVRNIFPFLNSYPNGSYRFLNHICFLIYILY